MTLQVRLRKGRDSVVLHDAIGGSGDHVDLSTLLDDFNGATCSGAWTCEMSDHAASNRGASVFWSLDLES